MSTDAVVVEIFSKKKAATWLACIAAVMVAIAMLGNVGIVFALLHG